jgi:histidinol-phosphate aminotransferase
MKPRPKGIRLFANESPYAPIPSVTAAISEAASAINRYPTPLLRSAAAFAIADRHDIDYRRISLGAGSMSLVHGLVHLVTEKGDEALQASPCYRAFADAVAVAGAELVSVGLNEHRHDLDAIAAAITPRTRVIYLNNPNNPTGAVIRRRELEAFMDRVPAEVLLILDEVYIDFAGDPDVASGIELAAGRDNVAVVRSFSKAYGLAGLRVGYSATNPEIAEILNRVLVPFSVSGIALAAAGAALRDGAAGEVKDRISRTVSERARVASELERLGLTVTPSGANFLYMPLGERASLLVETAAARGIEILLFPGAARVTIGAPAENDAFLDVASQFAGS